MLDQSIAAASVCWSQLGQ